MLTCVSYVFIFFFFFKVTATTESYTYLHTLSLHDALPIARKRKSAVSCSPISSAGTLPMAPAAAWDKAVKWSDSSVSHIQSAAARRKSRSEEHTSELQSLMRISYAVFCLKKKKTQNKPNKAYCHTNTYITTHIQYKS